MEDPVATRLIWELGGIVLCLVGSAFFSSSETALTSLSLPRLEALRLRGPRLRRAGFDRWARSPREFLITILVGNNLVNVLASALATSLAYHLSGSGNLGAVVGVMTLGILIFGEITPKSLAQAHAEAVARRVVGPLYVLDVALRPAAWLLGALARVLSRMGRRRAPVTEEDLHLMLSLAHRYRQLPGDEMRIMEAVLHFRKFVAREVMIPRPHVETVDTSWDLETLRARVAASGHSRFPVVEGAPDELTGTLLAKHLLRLEAGMDWRSLVTEPLYIPESRPLHELLDEMRQRRQHMALVLDEFGGFSGILTLEDVVELLVGEIEDEFDQERGEGIKKHGDAVIVPGHLALRRLERFLGRRLDPPMEVDSVGGLLTLMAQDPVRKGTRVTWRNLQLEALVVKEGRVEKVRIQPLASPHTS